MYLETWMIVVLALTFGACAMISRWFGFAAGVQDGMVSTLEFLEIEKIISITEDGEVLPYEAVAEVSLNTP